MIRRLLESKFEAMKSRKVHQWAFEIVGVALIALATGLMSLPLAPLVAGAYLVVVANQGE